MHPADINAALIKKGVTQQKLIDGTGYTDRSIVSHVVHGRRRSETLEAAIAEITGIPLHRLWPKNYPKPGKRKVA